VRGQNLRLLACAPALGVAGQGQLGRLSRQPGFRDVTAIATLAGRSDLDPGVASSLLNHPNLTVRVRARRRVSDPALLTRGLPASELAAVAANDHTPADLLADLTACDDLKVVLRAVCNPATPEQARRRALADPERNATLVHRASPTGATVVRAGELAAANPWLLEYAGAQRRSILRGLLTLPTCTPEILERHRGPGWASAAAHPARNGTTLGQMSLNELTESPSGAAHLELLSRADCTAAHAARLLRGHRTVSGRDIDPEPHVLARLVRRFGSGVFTRAAHLRRFSGTRIDSAGWAEPYAADLLTLFSSYGRSDPDPAYDLGAAAGAAALLGDDSDAWSLFARLVVDTYTHSSQLVEAAEVALAV
jgi:hypothetical protein